MTDNLNVFAPVDRIAMPTPAVEPTKHIHKSRRAPHRRPPVIDQLLSIIEDGVVCCRAWRQPEATPTRAAGITSPDAAAVYIERP
jgi:hypothetical protein